MTAPTVMTASGGDRPGVPPFQPQDEGVREKRQGPVRIVVAEDEYLTALAIEESMDEERYEIIAIVSTAAQAVHAVERERPDFVLMDIKLGGSATDGVDAARDIYERFGVRSVFATAYADRWMRARAAPYRPLGWLPKPFNDRQLQRVLEAACREIDAH